MISESEIENNEEIIDNQLPFHGKIELNRPIENMENAIDESQSS